MAAAWAEGRRRRNLTGHHDVVARLARAGPGGPRVVTSLRQGVFLWFFDYGSCHVLVRVVPSHVQLRVRVRSGKSCAGALIIIQPAILITTIRSDDSFQSVPPWKLLT
jgi:hypothetical protein